MRATAARTLQEFSVFGFKNSQAGVEQFAFRNHDDVVARSDLVQTENLSYQSFRAIPLNRSAQLLRRGDPQPTDRALNGQQEDRAVAAVNLDAAFVDLLEVCSTADFLVGTKHSASRPAADVSGYSLLTVSRLRPLARRRFSTRRPFLVLIRTRKPCVFAR